MSLADPTIIMQIKAENKAGKVLEQTKQQARQAGNEMENANNKSADSANRAETSTLALGASVLGLAVSVKGLTDGFIGLQTKMVDVQKIQLDVEKTEQSIIIAQRALNEAIKQGATNTPEFSDKIASLNFLLDDLTIKEQEAKIKQDELNSTFLNLAFSGASTALFAITTITTVMPQLRLSMEGLKASTFGTTLATKGLGAAMKGVFISNPILLPLIAITTLLTLVATNAFGIRDAIVELGATIQKFLDTHIKPLGDALRFLTENVLVPLGEALGITQSELDSLEGPESIIGKAALADLKRAEEQIGVVSQLTDELDKKQKDVESVERKTKTAREKTQRISFDESVKSVKDFKLRVVFEDSQGIVIGGETLDIINDEAVVRLKRRGETF